MLSKQNSRNRDKIKTLDEAIEILHKTNENIEFFAAPNGFTRWYNKDIQFLCKCCNDIFVCCFYDAMIRKSCPKCSRKRGALKQSEQKKTSFIKAKQLLYISRPQIEIIQIPNDFWGVTDNRVVMCCSVCLLEVTCSINHMIQMNCSNCRKRARQQEKFSERLKAAQKRLIDSSKSCNISIVESFTALTSWTTTMKCNICMLIFTSSVAYTANFGCQSKFCKKLRIKNTRQVSFADADFRISSLYEHISLIEHKFDMISQTNCWFECKKCDACFNRKYSETLKHGCLVCSSRKEWKLQYKLGKKSIEIHGKKSFVYDCDGCKIEFVGLRPASNVFVFCNRECFQQSMFNETSKVNVHVRQQLAILIADDDRKHAWLSKIIETSMHKYGTKHPHQSEIVKSRIDYKKLWKKIHESMKINGSYKRSKSEDLLKDILYMIFGEQNVKPQAEIEHDDGMWFIDFFIVPLHLFIQFDGAYWHGLDRPIEEIRKSGSSRDQSIAWAYDRDRKQDIWFNERKMLLLRINEKDFKKTLASTSDQLLFVQQMIHSKVCY